MRWPLLCCLVFFGTLAIQAQSPLNVKAGISIQRFQDEKELNEGLWHAEHRYGFDVLIHAYRTLFIPGFHYHRLSIRGEEDLSITEVFNARQNFHQIRIPFSVGYAIKDISTVKWNVYVGPHVNFVVGIDDNQADLNFDQVHELSFGLQAGMQFSISILTLDLYLDHGLTKIIKAREDSKSRGMGLSVGVKL